MNSLKEITQVIARLKLEKIEIIDEEPGLGDQDNISKLYFGIKSNSITTDQEAAKLIYNSPLVDSRFTTLKNRLKTKLLNTLFFLDIKAPAQSEMAENMYKTYRYTFCSKTLLLIGARESSKKMAQKGLLFAERSALTAEIVQLLTDLRNLAGGSGNTTEYRDLNEHLKRHTHNLLAELQARDFNDQIRMMYAKTTAENPEAISVVDNFVSSLDSIEPKPDSFYYKLFYYRVKIYALQVKQMYDEMIEVCDAGEQLFLSSPILSSNIRLGEFVVYKLYGYLLLKKFSEGEREAKRAIEL